MSIMARMGRISENVLLWAGGWWFAVAVLAYRTLLDFLG
jgi:hypothetical protein